MAASYPTNSKSFTTKTNAVDIADASHINDLQAEVTAVETDLLSGTPTYITKVTTGVNASALSTGTVPLDRLVAANATANGILTTTTQTITGDKTFDTRVALLNRIAVGNPGYADTVLKDHPESYWRFEENGNLLFDQMPTNDIISFGPGVQFKIPGAIGGTTTGLATSYVTATLDNTLTCNIGDPFTIEFWVRPLSPANATGGSVIMANLTSNVDAFQSLSITDTYLGDNVNYDYVELGYYTPADGYFVSNTQLKTDGTLYHIALTVDASGSATFYLNGAPDGTFTITESFNIGRLFTDSTLPENGRIPTLRSNLIDEIAVYPTQLSQGTVASHYTLGLANDPVSYRAAVAASTPKAYWQLEEATGATAIVDSVAGTYNATLTSALSPVARTPGGFSDGSRGLVLDETQVAAVTALGPYFGGGKFPFSFEFWIKPSSLAGGEDGAEGLLGSNYSSEYGFLFKQNDSNQVRLMFRATPISDTYLHTTPLETNGALYHIVVTSERTNTDEMTILTYVNGVLDGTVILNSINDVWNLEIEHFFNTHDGLKPLHAALFDELATYKATLTPTQISNHYAARLSATDYDTIVSQANTATLTPTSLKIGTQTVNTHGVYAGTDGARASITYESMSVTNVTSNTTIAPGIITIGSATLNSTAYTQTANNATYAFGKSEGALNVNAASSADSANNATYAFGKSESELNVNTAAIANNATYAFGKSEGELNVNAAATANNSTYAFGKSEGELDVNNASTATTANNSTYAFGKSEGELNVNAASTADTANNATYAFGKSEGELNVNSAASSNNSTYAFGKSEGELDVNSASTSATANNATYAFGKSEGELNVNSAAAANNSTYVFGKSEGELNVNSAITATTANNTTYAFGKSENDLNVNSASTANNSTYAFGKSENGLNVNSAAIANNSTYAFGKSENGLNVNSAAIANNSTYAFGKSENALNVNSASAATTAMTANNSTYAFGKSENALNVNSASSATTANNSTYAFGKSEGALNVNSASTAVTANNATYAFGKSENALNVNSAAQASNATNLNNQPGSYYTNATNISTGTLPLAQLDANVLLTTSTTGINASALSTGTVPATQLPVANDMVAGIVSNTTQTFGGNKTFHDNVIITGNLNVLGTTFTVSANNLIVEDSLIQLAANNLTTDALDIGVYGNYNPDGGDHEHTGIFRDASDGVWKLFQGLQTAPTSTIDITGTGYAIGTLQTYLTSGGVVVNSAGVTITANGSYSAALTVNTVSAQTFTGNLTGTAATANNATYAFGKSEAALNVNSAATANNSTYAFGKSEGALNVNSATTATTANNSTYAFGKTEGALNVNSATTATTATTANNATYAFGKSESGLNVNNALTANQSTYLAGAAVTGNSTTLTVGANVYVSQSTVFVGNATANGVLTSLQFVVANATNTATLTPISLTIGTQVANTLGFYAGANVYANTTTVFFGNATVNSVHTSASISVANSTNTATLTPVSLTIGSSVINTLSLTINNISISGNLTANGSNGSSGQVLTSNGTGLYWAAAVAGAAANSTGGTGAIQYYNGTSLGSSSNLVFSGTNVFVGNTTANGNYGQTSVAVANATGTATLTPVSLTIGTQVSNTLGFYAGANVYANTTTMFFGNATVNLVHTSTSVTLANSTNTATLTPISLTIGGSVVNTTALYDQYDNIRAVPINSQTTAYTLVSADNGRTISSNANITVNGAVLFANQVFTIYNNSTASITIAPGTGATIYLAGSADTSTRTLAQRGLATIYCVAANTFVIAGAGLI